MEGLESDPRFRPMVWELLAILLSVSAGFGLTRIVEGAAGWYLYSSHRNAGLIWGPYSVVEHATDEFSYQVKINNLGFRDRDFAPGKSGAKRILVIGDSFVYGWGVAAESSWPKVMEKELRRGGLDIEVANLGSPGAGPAEYAALAARAIPVLQPDLVVVAMLQADDLYQAADTPGERPAPGGEKVLRAVRAYYPNMMQVLSPADVKQIHVSKKELREIWKKQVADFERQMTATERLRFEGLPTVIRAAYQGGGLNPGLLFMAIRHREFLIETCDLAGKGRRGIDATARELAKIRQYSEGARADLLVVSVPYRAYVSARDQADMTREGFDIDEAMTSWTTPDDAIQEASRGAQVTFASVTADFRERARANELYFAMDGHFNEAGHAAFGELAGRVVRTKIGER